jgi:hypothetical protein
VDQRAILSFKCDGLKLRRCLMGFKSGDYVSNFNLQEMVSVFDQFGSSLKLEL